MQLFAVFVQFARANEESVQITMQQYAIRSRKTRIREQKRDTSVANHEQRYVTSPHERYDIQFLISIFGKVGDKLMRHFYKMIRPRIRRDQI